MACHPRASLTRLLIVRAFIDRLSRPQLVLAGALAGFTWGVLIRLWMRLISTNPEFTWGGTLYILGAATILGVGVAGAAAGRRSPRRWARRVTRVLGGISLIFLSVAAGVILVASVLPATLALAERRWWMIVRVALFGLSLLPLRALIGELQQEFTTPKVLVATVLYLALASVLIVAWGSVVRSRPSRRAVRRQAEREADRVGSLGDGSLELVG